MSGEAWLITVLVLGVLILGLVLTIRGFQRRARDPLHRRRLGDRIRSRWGS